MEGCGALIKECKVTCKGFETVRKKNEAGCETAERSVWPTGKGGHPQIGV
jgi:hypothetical protein